MFSYMYVSGRYKFFNSLRLDAGTFGTMGVGCGFSLAAALVEEEREKEDRSCVICIQGDSAFGFSGMEVETACRLVEYPNEYSLLSSRPCSIPRNSFFH